MECLQFFAAQTKTPTSPFVKVVVTMFTEQISKRCFPTLEFSPIQVRGDAEEIADTPNDVILDKAWLVYSNICKIGQEFTATKSKARTSF